LRTIRQLIIQSMVLAAVTGCGDDPAGPVDDLQGGALATFQVSGEQFHVWITNDAVIEQIFDLRDGLSTANIPNGVIHEGPGPGDHNSPWLWHIDSEDIEMADATIEVCDGRPSLVDSLLEAYLAVGRFCPWGAELVSIEDRR